MRVFAVAAIGLVFASMISSNSSADLVFTIGNETSTANGAVTISVFGQSSDDTAGVDSIDIDGFNFLVDFGGNGFGLPSAFPAFDNIGATFGVGFISAIVDTTTAPAINAFAPPVSWDVGFYGTFSTTVTFTDSTPRKLFDIAFIVPGSAIAGVYPINAVLGGESTANFNAGPQAVNAVNGSLTITAVPEPSSFAMLSLLGLGIGAYRFRFKRS